MSSWCTSPADTLKSYNHDDDIAVVRVEGCVSVVGFIQLLGKSLKLVIVDTVYEDTVDAVKRQVTCEARAVKHNITF